jgi:radical SAM protein with 4Fe4S-binding SPASM domain
MNSRRFGMPVSVQIEVTTKCNLSCPFCLRVTDPARIIDADMSLNLYKSIVNQIKGRTCGVNLVGLGEPLLHPEIFSMIRFAKENGLEVSLVDNFTLVDQEKSLQLINSGLDFLYVSFDSTSKEIFEKTRRGAYFERIIENIQIFVKTKRDLKAKTPVFLLKATITSNNFNEVPKLIECAEDLGTDGINFGKIRTKDPVSKIYPPPLDKTDFPKSKIPVHLNELSDSYQCNATNGCYITYNGKVLPCGLMAESVSRADYPQVELGDLKYDTLANIWRSNRFRQVRKNIKARKYLLECKTCAGYKKRKK